MQFEGRTEYEQENLSLPDVIAVYQEQLEIHIFYFLLLE